jgi:hypothetical protein
MVLFDLEMDENDLCFFHRTFRLTVGGSVASRVASADRCRTSCAFPVIPTFCGDSQFNVALAVRNDCPLSSHEFVRALASQAHGCEQEQIEPECLAQRNGCVGDVWDFDMAIKAREKCDDDK